MRSDPRWFATAGNQRDEDELAALRWLYNDSKLTFNDLGAARSTSEPLRSFIAALGLVVDLRRYIIGDGNPDSRPWRLFTVLSDRLRAVGKNAEADEAATLAQSRQARFDRFDWDKNFALRRS